MTAPATKILALAGSARRDSVNKKLLQAAVRQISDPDIEVTVLDLADFPLPLYDGDLEDEKGVPENALRLKEHFLQHDALLLACPEYNSSITPLLKNLIDWVSRPTRDDEPTLAAYRRKVAGLLAASPGGLGGLRGLRHVREILGNIGVTVVPTQHALSGAYDAFDDEGNLKDASVRDGVRRVTEQLVHTARALREANRKG